MDFKAASRLFIDAIVIGFFGVCLALAGWAFAFDKMVEVISRGDMLVSLSIVGSAFLILGALSFISQQLSELIDVIRDQS